MDWNRWRDRKPLWEENRLEEWIALNPFDRGVINIAAVRMIGAADPKDTDRLTRFEAGRVDTLARTGRLYYGDAFSDDRHAELCAAVLALCWRYVMAPRIVDSSWVLEEIVQRRSIYIAGCADDVRDVLIQSPFLYLRNVQIPPNPSAAYALQHLLSRRLNDGQTTLISFAKPDVFDKFGAHWAHSGNEIVAVALETI